MRGEGRDYWQGNKASDESAHSLVLSLLSHALEEVRQGGSSDLCMTRFEAPMRVLLRETIGLIYDELIKF